MSYCPSQDWDCYCANEDLSCQACGSNENEHSECEECGGVICDRCHYCPDCHKDIEFSVLPEDYFWRICSNCKGSMVWGDISTFSDLISGEPIPVHRHCLSEAKRENATLFHDYKNAMKKVY